MKIAQLICLLVSLIGAFVVTVTSPVMAADNNAAKRAACVGIGGDFDDGTGQCSAGSTKATPQGLMSTIIQLFAWVVGAISVIMLIWGGLKYITSGGDSGKISSAKNTIIYAIIGLIIVALSVSIVNFVLARTSDAVKQADIDSFGYSKLS